MANICVTGACGFIGSNLCKRLLAGGHTVYGVDNLVAGYKEFLPGEVKFYPTCFADPNFLNEIKHLKLDVIVHLAATPRVSYSVEHPLETNKNNVTRTLRLIDVAQKHVKRFIFSSSSSVYGGAVDGPTKESTTKRPRSPYALQKSIVEDYLAMWNDLYGLDAVSLRFFNVFGPFALGNSPYSTAVSAWLTAIKEGRPLRYDGDGSQSRDMCYVDNVVDCIIRASDLSRQNLAGERINVACGESITNEAVYGYLKARYDGIHRIDAPWRAGDVRHTLADISKAKNILGYEPIVRVMDGLAKTCDWYDTNWCWVSKLPKK